MAPAAMAMSIRDLSSGLESQNPIRVEVRYKRGEWNAEAILGGNGVPARGPQATSDVNALCRYRRKSIPLSAASAVAVIFSFESRLYFGGMKLSSSSTGGPPACMMFGTVLPVFFKAVIRTW